MFLRFLDEIEKERKVGNVHGIWNENHVYILITLTRIRSNKKLPDPPPAPPRRLNKNRLFLGSSSVTVSAWASSSAFDDKALSDDTSLSKTQHQTSSLYYYLSFCEYRRDTISRVTVNVREPRTFKHTYYTIIHVLYTYILTRTVSIRHRRTF